MAQKAVRSEASSPNSLGPERDWPEVRGEECLDPWTSGGTEQNETEDSPPGRDRP